MSQACLDEWIARNRAQSRFVQEWTRGLSSHDMHWNPAPGKWSIAQCLDHLNQTARQYGPALEGALAKNLPMRGAFAPSWMQRKMLHMVGPANPRRLKAPRSFQAAATPESDGVEDFLHLQEELVRCMQAAQGLDLNRSKLRSPALPILRLSLGVAFDLLGLHAQRHLNQAQRVRSAEGFPGPAPDHPGR